VLGEGAHAGALPLGRRERRQLRRHLVTIGEQPVKHHGQIGVGDGEGVEQAGAAVGDEGGGGGEQLGRGGLTRR